MRQILRVSPHFKPQIAPPNQGRPKPFQGLKGSPSKYKFEYIVGKEVDCWCSSDRYYGGRQSSSSSARRTYRRSLYSALPFCSNAAVSLLLVSLSTRKRERCANPLPPPPRHRWPISWCGQAPTSAHFPQRYTHRRHSELCSFCLNLQFSHWLLLTSHWV
jgi:hypothetical protein